jgi:hypothetical protein
MAISITWFALLYAAFAMKHFLADFVFQLDWMVSGKEQARGWAGALAAHAGCHAALTRLIALVVFPGLWWLGPVDLVILGGIDRAKGWALQRLKLRQNDPGWWRVFGADAAPSCPSAVRPGYRGPPPSIAWNSSRERLSPENGFVSQSQDAQRHRVPSIVCPSRWRPQQPLRAFGREGLQRIRNLTWTFDACGDAW